MNKLHYRSKDITGRTFGLLTALSHDRSEPPDQWWLYRCVCGREVVARYRDVTHGKKKSCGCIGRGSGKLFAGIGARDIPEYKVWMSMRQRCTNEHRHNYHRYGGRGISICKRWEDFKVFLADMGRRPSADHSIDRYPNNDGNYEPGNCRWATRAEQSQNRSVSIAKRRKESLGAASL